MSNIFFYKNFKKYKFLYIFQGFKIYENKFFHENSEIFFEKNRIKILANETFVHRFLLCFTALDQGNQQKHRFVLFADNFVKADDFRWLKMQLKLKY